MFLQQEHFVGGAGPFLPHYMKFYNTRYWELGDIQHEVVFRKNIRHVSSDEVLNAINKFLTQVSINSWKVMTTSSITVTNANVSVECDEADKEVKV